MQKTAAHAALSSATGELVAATRMTKPALTKIVATIGPASSSPDLIARLIEEGVSIFRLNFSHGALADHAARASAIRDAARALGRPVAIMGDLQGPKIRVGQVAGSGIDVQPGDTVLFRRGEFTAQASDRPRRFACTYTGLVDDARPGHRLLVNDGAVRMLVLARRADELECSVTVGGLISSSKGINLPDTHLNVETLNARDWAHVEWSLENDLDFMALSFVRSAADVIELKEGLARMASRARPTATPRDDAEDAALLGRLEPNSACPLRVIAKIELPEAVERMESIIEAADGIMVARGDLGVEMDLARVPVIQKKLLNAASAYGKPCIVATQMLESMMHAPNPTRAEASDISGAIEDGADALMLSGETAVGKYAALAVQSMRRIAEHTEQYLASLPQLPSPPQKLVESRYRTAALAHGAWMIAQDIGAKFIVVWSQQGGGARYLSQNNFTVPIIAITSSERAARQMQLLRGVVPLRMPAPESLAHFTAMVDAYLLETGWAAHGDPCILMAGAPIGQTGATNRLAIHAIGDATTGFALG